MNYTGVAVKKAAKIFQFIQPIKLNIVERYNKPAWMFTTKGNKHCVLLGLKLISQLFP